MTPSWYDVLGVEPDATPAEIRAAWKDAIADLDPTDRRFKLRNQAAEILLDPERRAAHDADLAAQPPDEEPVVELAEPTAASAVTLDKPADDDAATVASIPARAGGAADAAEVSDRRPRRLSPVLMLVLGVVALALVVATVVSIVAGGEADDGDGLPDAEEIAAARGAAESAVGPVLSYDYRNLDASKAAALSYLTTSYGEEYQRNFEGVVRPAALQTETVVAAQFVASGIVRTGRDRVDVLVFVNRPTTKGGQVDVFHDYVTLRMLEEDDSWKVDCLVVALPGDAPSGSCAED